jgi:Leucine-rich repeat (LRR) protein
MGNSSSSKGKQTSVASTGGGGAAISTKVNNMNLNSRSTNVINQKLKNARATGMLSLRESNLKSVPVSVLELTMLHTLDLNKNGIKELPQEFLALQKLKILHLHDNKLVQLPSLVSLSKLATLSIDRNRLTSLCDLPTQKFSKLFANGNQFTELPPQLLAVGKTLTVLELSNNQIKLLPPCVPSALFLNECPPSTD